MKNHKRSLSLLVKPFKIEPTFQQEPIKEPTPENSRVLAANGRENLQENGKNNQNLAEFAQKIIEIFNLSEKTEQNNVLSTKNLEKIIEKSINFIYFTLKQVFLQNPRKGKKVL